MKQIVVIDGKGGKMGAAVVELIKKNFDNVEVIAVGTNGIATAAMIKAGADEGASGENPVIVACRTADIIVCPIGIVIADSLLGEVTPKMAVAVGQSAAQLVLLPVNKCKNHVIGVSDTLSVSEIMNLVKMKISELL